MMLFVLPLLLQVAQPASNRNSGLERLVAEQEATRDISGGLVDRALQSNYVHVQQLALRALGRRQTPDVRDAVLPFLRSPNAGVRMEAANALGQMNADVDYESYLRSEKTDSVRAVLFETIGRVRTAPANAEALLVAGLGETSVVARTGAARGLEWFARRNARTKPLGPQSLDAIHTAFRTNSNVAIRELLLLSMNASRDTSSATYNLALQDMNALVRRLSVLGTRKWTEDKSPIVRFEALKLAGNCERALQLSNDENETVQLAAIDMLGDKKCNAAPLETFVRSGRNWRTRSHALVALAKSAPATAKGELSTFANDRSWHSRVYAASAARVLGDSATLQRLARDTQPNVAIAAMTTTTDAIYGLGSNHAGLLFAAAKKLKGQPELVGLGPQIISAIEQQGVMSKSSSADARNELLARLTEILQQELAAVTRQYGAERASDTTLMSSNALRIAQELRKWNAAGENAQPALLNTPLENAATIERNRGATARIVMKGLGTMTLELLYDVAPRTVTAFAALADSGKYNGTTFHRVEPNFVLQGGSPGADEYDGQTQQFMRDEVGRTSHARGTLGISTRGYDKGDGQIFVNTVDNFRLDYQYTVFARITSGLDIIDRIQEGDVIESITIIRKR